MKSKITASRSQFPRWLGRVGLLLRAERSILCRWLWKLPRRMGI